MRSWHVNGVDVQHLFQEMYPVDSVRENVLRLTLSAISEVNSFAPQAWGLTLWDYALRLNVGSTEGLTLSTNRIRMMLAADRSRADFADLPIVATQYSSGALSQCAFDGAVQTYFENESLLYPMHLTYIRAAVTTKKGRPWRGTRHAMGYELELWELLKDMEVHASLNRSNPAYDVQYSEGDRYSVQLDQHERSVAARAACLAHHGYNCAVCGMNFETFYGQVGHQYVQVHHLKPISDGNRVTDPILDLIPVCANCHAMLHRKDPPIGVDELRATVFNLRSLIE